MPVRTIWVPQTRSAIAASTLSSASMVRQALLQRGAVTTVIGPRPCVRRSEPRSSAPVGPCRRAVAGGATPFEVMRSIGHPSLYIVNIRQNTVDRRRANK
jgi:hypothetical protein